MMAINRDAVVNLNGSSTSTTGNMLSTNSCHVKSPLQSPLSYTSSTAVTPPSSTLGTSSSGTTSPFPFAINCRLTKTFFGVPRKCQKCQKMIVFTAGYACQFCSYRCHRKCTADTTMWQRSKMCSLSRLPQTNDGGDQATAHTDDHVDELDAQMIHMYAQQWVGLNSSRAQSPALAGSTKNSVGDCSTLNELETMLKQAPRRYNQFRSSTSALEDGNAESGGVYGSTGSIHTITSEPTSPHGPNKQLSTDTYCAAANGDNVSRASTLKVHVTECGAEEVPPSTVQIVEPEPEETSVMDRIMKLWPWGQPTASPTNSSTAEPDVQPGRRVGRGSTNGASSRVDSFNEELLQHMLHKHKHSTASSIGTGSLADSAISSYTGCSSSVSGIGNNASMLTRRLAWVRHIVGERGAHSQDCVTPPLRNQSIDEGAEPIGMQMNTSTLQAGGPRNGFAIMPSRESQMCSSWPVLGLHLNYDSDQITISDAEESDSEANNALHRRYSQQQSSSCLLDTNDWGMEAASSMENALERDSFRDLGEWAINYEDLTFADCVCSGRSVKTYRGRWHGEVMIHKYAHAHLERFLRDVHTLSKIRHENIALFMGACMEPPNLAIITCIRKGESLHDTIHLRGRRLTIGTKMNIAKQLAQGIGYLHAKGIVLRCLTSKSVFVGGKVKICTVDYGGPYNRHNCTLVYRNQLSYMPPEIVRTLLIEPPLLRIHPRLLTKQADIYAFGTLMYEMLASAFPMGEQHLQTVIYRVGNGHRQSVKDLRCHRSTRQLISDCWTTDAAYRPTAAHILQHLHHDVTLSKRHSSSDPRALHKTGCAKH